MLEPILSVTYGCIVYQEQVIQIFQQLGGYSLGQADMVRRAISKKKAKEIEKERHSFVHGDPERGIKGCVANGIPEATAEAIYDEIYDFANYAFNKAHAVSYAVVAYQTAYFKCHFTKEYMAALLTSVLHNSDKVAEYIAECRDCGISVLPPDINHSRDGFTVDGENIRFGLVAIKNIGRGFIQTLIKRRDKDGPFTSFQDFCQRMDDCTDMNKRAVENLIRSGAFDSLGAKRSQLVAVFESVLDGVAASRAQNLEGQLDFFSMGSSASAKLQDVHLPDISEFTAIEKMYNMILEPWVQDIFYQNARFLYEKRFEIWANPRMASALTGTVYYNGKRVTIGGYLKAVEMHPDLFFTRNSLIVSFGGSPLSGASVNTAVNLKNGRIRSFKGGSFGSRMRAYVDGHAIYPIREWAFPLSMVVEMLKINDR